MRRAHVLRRVSLALGFAHVSYTFQTIIGISLTTGAQGREGGGEGCLNGRDSDFGIFRVSTAPQTLLILLL